METPRQAIGVRVWWRGPFPYAFVALVIAMLGGLSFYAAQNASATMWLNQWVRIDPFTLAEWCAGGFVVALVLAGSPSLRVLLGHVRDRLPRPTKTDARMGRVPNLDILRLILAVLVVTEHIPFISTGQGYCPWIRFNNVAAFIAISGFVIPGSLAASQSIGHFAWKRFLRIGPTLIACLAAIVLIWGRADANATIVYYATAGLLTIGFVPDGALWSLMPEEVLYTFHVGLRCLFKKSWLSGRRSDRSGRRGYFQRNVEAPAVC